MATAPQLGEAGPPRPTSQAGLVWSTDIYAQVRKVANALIASERPDHTLTGTALTHETLAVMAETEWHSDCPSHRLSVAVRVARRLLIDHERARGARKRGGAGQRVSLDPDRLPAGQSVEELEEIHDALGELSMLHERQADVVEMRFFLGFSERQAANFLGVSERTVRYDWVAARAWLAARLTQD